MSIFNIDYGPMLTHEYNAQVKDDLFTTEHRPFAGADDYEEGEKKSSVLDLLLPVIVLIGLCIVGLIWTGGMWDAESDNYHNFVMSFSDATAGVGLCSARSSPSSSPSFTTGAAASSASRSPSSPSPTALSR